MWPAMVGFWQTSFGGKLRIQEAVGLNRLQPNRVKSDSLPDDNMQEE
jgi:hypothetical protein